MDVEKYINGYELFSITATLGQIIPLLINNTHYLMVQKLEYITKF